MKKLALLSAAFAGAGLLASARDADACGGCFGPTQTVTVVTDHRMILSVSPLQTTLYDQIKYQGDPSSFAWVLPIHGTVDVGLSADVLFGSLDAITQTTIRPPPRQCAPPPYCGNEDRNAPSFAADASAGAAEDGGVTITKQETVGPYATVQLSSKDPAALENWLVMNGFNIPNDIKPVITAYVNEGFDFLALKLIPGQGISSMRPVRVTTMGASPVLPLRMVAAGTGNTVGITLWIVGEGRYEPTNFPSFYIPTTDLVWDWKTSSSNYTTLRANIEANSGNKAWETESSFQVSRYEIQSYVLGGGYRFGQAPAENDYLPVMGPVPLTAEQVRQADLDTLFAGITMGQEQITRIRTDLAHSVLNQDLDVSASADQTMLFPQRQLSHDVNAPACPSYPPCSGNPVVDNAFGLHGGCATTPEASTSSDVGLGFAAGFIGIAVIRARRRRR